MAVFFLSQSYYIWCMLSILHTKLSGIVASSHELRAIWLSQNIWKKRKKMRACFCTWIEYGMNDSDGILIPFRSSVSTVILYILDTCGQNLSSYASIECQYVRMWSVPSKMHFTRWKLHTMVIQRPRQFCAYFRTKIPFDLFSSFESPGNSFFTRYKCIARHMQSSPG